MVTSGIRVADGGKAELIGFRARRLKALLELSRHPELDEENWTGQVLFHFGTGRSVKAAIHPASREIGE